MMMIMMMNSRIGNLTWSASCFVVSSSYTLLNQMGQQSTTTSTKSSKWCSHTWWHGSTSGPSRTPWQPPTGWKLATTGFWQSEEVSNFSGLRAQWDWEERLSLQGDQVQFFVENQKLKHLKYPTPGVNMSTRWFSSIGWNTWLEAVTGARNRKRATCPPTLVIIWQWWRSGEETRGYRGVWTQSRLWLKRFSSKMFCYKKATTNRSKTATKSNSTELPLINY